MAAPCPTCGKDVDPLRAPAVRVIAGKITAYCSAECADGLPRAAGAVSLPAPPRRATTATPAARRAASSTAVAIETEADVEAPRVAPRRRSRLVLWLLAGIVVGGMAVAIVQAVSPSSPASVEAGDPRRPAPAIDAGPDAAR